MYTSASQIDNVDARCPSTPLGVPFTLPVGGTSWSAVPNKTGDLTAEPTAADFTDVFTMGWLRRSERSGADLPLVHAHMHSTAKSTFWHVLIGAASCATLNVAVCGAGLYGGQEAEGSLGAWSDWGLHVRPLALSLPQDPNGTLVNPGAFASPPFWNLLAAEGNPVFEGQDHAPAMGDMEVEWENDWYGWNTLELEHVPPAGSLVMLNGRWIVDCGHPPFHAEIHPPNTIVALETLAPFPTAPPVPPARPVSPVTRAQIWANEFYEGHPFQIKVWAPPRPTPDAQPANLLESFNPVVSNPDHSVTYTFFNADVGPFGPDPNTSTVTVSQAPEGLAVSISGPASSHEVKGTGQAISPSDEPDTAGGAVGSFVGMWFVTWNQ
jgi:hypothetical protein